MHARSIVNPLPTPVLGPARPLGSPRSGANLSSLSLLSGGRDERREPDARGSRAKNCVLKDALLSFKPLFAYPLARLTACPPARLPA